MAFDPARSYDDLPPLPPPVDVETAPVLKQCLRATRALAELNDARTADPQTKEVLRYRTALRGGYETVRDRGLSVALLREVCSVLRNRDGLFRRAGEIVHIGNPRTREIRYTPPMGGSPVDERLSNLEQYLLKDEGPDELIRMAVAHYQFEAIHPFDDGNGRTGRILNILYLVHAGLLELPVLYLSRYLIQHRQEYYRLLLEVTAEQSWEKWIVFMLSGVEETAKWTTERVRAIRRLLDDTVERVRNEAPAVYSKELVELLFHQPYSKIVFLVEAGIAKRQTAAEYLGTLEELGILQSEMVGRERIFVNVPLMNLLTEESL